MNDSYYTESAYESARIEQLPRIDNSRFNATTRRLRKSPLHRLPSAQCKEFLIADSEKIIDLLNSNNDEALRDIASPGHQEQEWQTLRNPKAIVEIIANIMWFFLIIAWVLFIIALVVGIFSWSEIKPSSSTFLKVKYFVIYYFKVMVFPIIPTVIYLIAKFLLKKRMVSDKNNVILSRRKGTILRPSMDNPKREIPFEEFDAYLGSSLNSSGLTCYHLWLCHRYSELWVSHPGEHYDEWRIYQEWEFWQQYMDVSQPLPDVPRMEPFRTRDPVTAAYDQAHRRPKDYWKNMDIEAAGKMRDAALEAGAKYPWGATREQALARGWTPSGFGEGEWRSNPQEEKPQAKVPPA